MVDFWRIGAKAVFIGLDLGSHGHGHQSTTMKSIVEGDNGGSSCCITNNLDSIFNRLCPTIEEESFLGKVSRRYVNDPLGKCNIRFVHHHAKASMREFSSLFGNGSGHLRTSMTNIHGTNATCKVDIAITIDIFDDGPIGFRCKYVHRGSNTACHELLAPCQKFTRFCSGDVIRSTVGHSSLLIDWEQIVNKL